MPRICFVSIDVEPDFGKHGFRGVEDLDRILDIFKEEQIPATLFVCGQVLQQYTERFEERGNLLAGGFEIASHSFSHRFWDKLSQTEREQELDKFIELYQRVFGKPPFGFRAPSHLLDTAGMKLLAEKGFLYDSSILPYYPFFKKYRGFLGKAPYQPYQPSIENCREKGRMVILEIPVTGHLWGVPLVGTWLRKLPFLVYRKLFWLKRPSFLTLTLHSWDSLSPKTLQKLKKLLRLLKRKNYQFLSGFQIYELFSKNQPGSKMAGIVE